MKALLIGGTGIISTPITEQLSVQGWDVYLINRGHNNDRVPATVHQLQVDVNNEAEVAQLIQGMEFDVVADFIAFHPAQVERDFRLFHGKTKQFMFISSASAYQKPLSDYRITEGTTLSNPYWAYSRNKIACEEYLLSKYRDDGFPITIVRPSHTYDERSIPLGVHGKRGSWQVAKRMLEHKPVIIHGDGTSLWAMTHARDVAKGFIGLMGNLHAIGEAVHITSDESLTWNQIYAAIADALGVTLQPVYVASTFLDACMPEGERGGLLGDKSHSVVFDNAKLKKLVPDYVATTRFDQGIRQTIQYILAHAELQKEDKDFDVWCDAVIHALQVAKNSIVG